MAKTKTKKPLLGEQPASPIVAEAIRQLIRTRARAAVLKQRNALLVKIITDAGGGTAHGYRAAVSHVKGSQCYRMVRTKPHDIVKLYPLKVE